MSNMNWLSKSRWMAISGHWYLAVALTAFISLACSAGSQSVQGQTPPSAPSGHVLLYTDNAPGAIVWAHAHLWAANGQQYEVQIETSLADFNSAIPTRNWDYVIVAEKHAEGVPAYSGALSAYVNAGGWALIHRWKEDTANPPTANQIVNAPTASHVWMNGRTAWGYYRSTLEDPKASGNAPGYITRSFNDVGVQPTLVTYPLGMAALQRKVQSAAAMAEPAPGSCEAALKEQIKLIAEDFSTRTDKCIATYGPTTGNPTGNPEKLGNCLNNAANAMRDLVRIAVEDYFVCVDARTAPPAQ